MKPYPKIILKSGKDEAVKRFHPWIFSGAIKKIDGFPSEGDIVEVYSNHNEYLGTGHFQDSSIAIRIFSFEQMIPDFNFWKNKIARAYQLRNTLGLVNKLNTNAFRLIHAEGDGMPGMIIDIYNKTAVIQTYTLGMHLIKPDIAKAVVEVFDGTIEAVYDKSSETMPKIPGVVFTDGYLFGSLVNDEILENCCKYKVNWQSGQKTGFFLDQRDNRQLLGQMCVNRKVLNTFCYTGGFSVAALKGGATLVHSVDSSQKAIDLTNQNIEMNGFSANKHQAYAEDTMEFLKNTTEAYDCIILDPPAYAKHIDAKHNAVQGYKRLNAKAIEIIQPGGIIFTFSCSQVVNRQLFNNTVIAAAIQAKRNIRILYQLSQPADHPVNIFHPEGEYLKGLVIYVE